MCDLTEVDYQKGDIVWVKLSNLWWPGMVEDFDSLPDEIKQDFKKQPFAVVKFLQEDSFEYVKSIHNIYHYNCLRKNEFIKKGLEMMRSTSRVSVSNSNMQMFPGDVVAAENLTQGDPKILERPEFKAEIEKEERGGKSVYEELFSTPKKLKKLKKESTTPVVKEIRRKTLPNKFIPVRNVTHPRFLNNSLDNLLQEHQYRVLIQSECKGKDLFSANNFACPHCNYRSSRVNVMTLHMRCHTRNYDQKPKKLGEKRKKKIHSSPLANENIPKKIKLTNGHASGVKIPKSVAKEKKTKTEIIETLKQEAEKIKSDFLKDWDDESDGDEDVSMGVDATSNSVVEKKEEEKVSCFDFDENEDDACSTSLAGFGKKGRSFSKTEENKKSLPPKVDEKIALPIVEEREAPRFTRRKSSNSDETRFSRRLSRGERKSDTAEKEKVSEKKPEKYKNEFDDELEELLKETKVPEIPDLPVVPLEKPEACTLVPPSTDLTTSDFGSLNKSDLNESMEFRSDVVKKTASTPAVPKENKSIIKQTLKKNYFQKFKQEIAEEAKFDEDEDKDNEDEDLEDEIHDLVTTVSKTIDEKNSEETPLPIDNDSTQSAVQIPSLKPEQSLLLRDNQSSVQIQEAKQNSPEVIKFVPKTSEVIRKSIETVQESPKLKTDIAQKPIQFLKSPLRVQTHTEIIKTPQLIGHKSPTTLKKSPEIVQISPDKPSLVAISAEKKDSLTNDLEKRKSQEPLVKSSPNIVQIGNQSIHLTPARKTVSESEKKNAEEDKLEDLMLVEEVDLNPNPLMARSRGRPSSTAVRHPSTAVHINVSPKNSSKQFMFEKMKDSTSIPTITPLESKMLVKPKYKTMNIPSSSTSMSQAGQIIFNDKRKDEFKSKKITISKSPKQFILTEEQTASRKQPIILSQPGRQKTGGVQYITMKQAEKKVKLPLPNLTKISTSVKQSPNLVKKKFVTAPGRASISNSSVKPPPVTRPNLLQNKIKTIASSNAARAALNSQVEVAQPAVESTSSDVIKSVPSSTIVVNPSTLPALLQQRKESQLPKGTPPTIVTEPKVIATAVTTSSEENTEIIADINSIPGVSLNDSVVYYIDDNQSQQLMFTNEGTSVPAEGPTIYIDPHTADFSGIYFTVDDAGNIINISQNIEAAAPATGTQGAPDLLAKALADTQVLQSEMISTSESPVIVQQPIVNNTIETSLTLNKAPIMATSEAPSQIQRVSTMYTTNSSLPLQTVVDNNGSGLPSPEIAYVPNDMQA